MNTLLPGSSSLPAGGRRRTFLVFAALTLAASCPLFAQNTDDPNRRRRGGENGGDRPAFNPQDMQDRMMSSLRERLEITDDEEWKLISERLGKVMEIRRSAGGGMFGGRGGPPGGGGPGGGNRGGGDRGGGDRGGDRGPRGGGSTEIAALSAAVRDKLPDAEIKSRLERVREMRKENEAKLAKAQEDLRAVLTVRQEAVAVVFGLLP